MTLLQLNIKFHYNYNVLRLFTIFLVNVLTFICLASIAFGRKKEVVFWRCYDELLKINENLLANAKPRINCNNMKIALLVALTVFPTIRVTLLVLRKSKERILPFMALSLIHMITIRVVAIKFMYFLGKLELCLEHLQSLLAYQIVPIGGSKSLKKSWKLSWQMSRLIEDLVGMPLVLLSGLIISGTVLNTYTALISFYNKEFEIGAVFSVIAVSLEVSIISKSCHNCYRSYRSVKGLIHQMYGAMDVESFSLQLKHQKILLAPMKMFTVDHVYLASVRLMNILLLQ